MVDGLSFIEDMMCVKDEILDQKLSLLTGSFSDGFDGRCWLFWTVRQIGNRGVGEYCQTHSRNLSAALASGNFLSGWNASGVG